MVPHSLSQDYPDEEEILYEGILEEEILYEGILLNFTVEFTYYSTNCFQKLHENKENRTDSGAWASAPPKSANKAFSHYHQNLEGRLCCCPL